MKHFLKCSFNVSKKEETADLLRKMFTLMEEEGWQDVRVLFSLTDNLTGKVSACARAVKDFPELAPYLQDFTAETLENSLLVGVMNDRQSYSILTNFSKAPPTENKPLSQTEINAVPQVPRHLLEALAEGTPKIYPFMNFSILFYKVPWNNSPLVLEHVLTPEMPALAIHLLPVSDYLSIVDASWVSGRSKAMEALVSDENAAGLSKDVLARLNGLGKLKSQHQIVLHSSEEQAWIEVCQPKMETLVQRYRNDLQIGTDFLNAFSFPHPMPEGISADGTGPSGKIDRKKIILSHLKSLGYNYYGAVSGKGTMGFRKQTQKGTKLLLSFDFGTWSRQLNGLLHIKNPWMETHVPVPFSPKARTYLQIDSPQFFDQAIEDMTSMLQKLESSLVQELEDLYGPAPDWYSF